jgi:hypothetical protein
MSTFTEKLAYSQHDFDLELSRSDSFASRLRQLEDKVTKLQLSQDAKISV